MTTTKALRVVFQHVFSAQTGHFLDQRILVIVYEQRPRAFDPTAQVIGR